MIFREPISFEEALAARGVREALPTELSSAELSRIGADILEYANFSARTANAQYLSRIDETIRSIVDGDLDPASARERLRDFLEQSGYQPEPELAGTIRDLSSDRRLQLVVKMNSDIARNAGYYEQGQSPAILDQWPAQEYVRFESREEERPWTQIWQAAGGTLYEGRMIARKDDPIWTNPTLNPLGNPYPPFDFNSGMGLRDVDRDEAERLGVIAEDEEAPAPDPRRFAQQAEASVGTMSDELREAVLADLGDAYEITDDGVLRRRAA